MQVLATTGNHGRNVVQCFKIPLAEDMKYDEGSELKGVPRQSMHPFKMNT